jgi:hypothetical protein
MGLELQYPYAMIVTQIRRAVDASCAGNHTALHCLAKLKAVTVFCFDSLHRDCHRNGIRKPSKNGKNSRMSSTEIRTLFKGSGRLDTHCLKCDTFSLRLRSVDCRKVALTSEELTLPHSRDKVLLENRNLLSK